MTNKGRETLEVKDADTQLRELVTELRRHEFAMKRLGSVANSISIPMHHETTPEFGNISEAQAYYAEKAEKMRRLETLRKALDEGRVEEKKLQHEIGTLIEDAGLFEENNSNDTNTTKTIVFCLEDIRLEADKAIFERLVLVVDKRVNDWREVSYDVNLRDRSEATSLAE